MTPLTWTTAMMPGPWVGDQCRYGITELNGTLYREHDGYVQVLTGRGWRGVPTLTDDGVKLTPDEAVIKHAAEVLLDEAHA